MKLWKKGESQSYLINLIGEDGQEIIDNLSFSNVADKNFNKANISLGESVEDTAHFC